MELDKKQKDILRMMHYDALEMNRQGELPTHDDAMVEAMQDGEEVYQAYKDVMREIDKYFIDEGFIDKELSILEGKNGI